MLGASSIWKRKQFGLSSKLRFLNILRAIPPELLQHQLPSVYLNCLPWNFLLVGRTCATTQLSPLTPVAPARMSAAVRALPVNGPQCLPAPGVADVITNNHGLIGWELARGCTPWV